MAAVNTFRLLLVYQTDGQESQAPLAEQNYLWMLQCKPEQPCMGGNQGFQTLSSSCDF